MQATLVILGTALSLQDAENAYSAVDKPSNFVRITDFPVFDENDIHKMLSDLVDMPGCKISPAICRKLSGRARFSLGIVNRLVGSGSAEGSKQDILDKAIDDTIVQVMNDLRDGVRRILKSDKSGDARFLCRMVLAYKLQGSKISFSSKQQSDFVNNALCRLRPHPDGIHFIMDEPMVVEEELRALGKDAEFSEYLDQFYQVIANFGVTPTVKGNAFEPLVRRSLQRFNGFRLVDLPFLRGIALPKWCDKFELQIDKVNTAVRFGYANDVKFLTDCPRNMMLVASSGARPDGVWFFSKRYAGSLAIKLYSSTLSTATHNANVTSSDIRSCFLQKDAITSNRSLSKLRNAFKKLGTSSNLKGILRIHLEFPRVSGTRPVTHVETNSEDVMVYIDVSNMDSFFDENAAGNKQDMVKLKKLIKFICT